MFYVICYTLCVTGWRWAILSARVEVGYTECTGGGRLYCVHGWRWALLFYVKYCVHGCIPTHIYNLYCIYIL